MLKTVSLSTLEIPGQVSLKSENCQTFLLSKIYRTDIPNPVYILINV